MIWHWDVLGGDILERADKSILSAYEKKLGQIQDSDLDSEIEGEALELPLLSRTRLHALMKEGLVTQGGKKLSPNDRLKPNQTVILHLPEPEKLELVPEQIDIEILYEDEHLLIVNKPPSMPVHPSPGHSRGTLVNALLHHIKDLSGIGGVLRPGIVHRLDKDTSGALVISKTDDCHQKLAKIFAEHRIERRYWALCYGSLPYTQEKRVESLIGRNPNDRKKMAMEVKGGRKAVTHITMIQEFLESRKNPFACQIEARLETGRTHQVRVHLTGLGHSLLGDPMYGEPGTQQPKWKALPKEIQKAVSELPGQALHARVLGFTHPITQKNLRFEAPLPPAYENLLTLLQNRYGSKL